MMNKYETELVRNDIDELLLVEPTEEFWNDKENWPEWLKDKCYSFVDKIDSLTDEDYAKGFIMYIDPTSRLNEEYESLFEFNGWEPGIFYGYNREAIWELTDDVVIGYFPPQDKLIFGPKWMFDLFFMRVVE